MRIPGRKIWRAFRELDEFSDEQCRRFIRAANPPSWTSVVRGVFLFAVGAGILVCVLYFLGPWTSDLDKRFRSDFAEWLVLLPLWTIAIAISPLSVLVLRDLLLRISIWRIINIGGSCANCHYPLYGLPLSETLDCSCPECGAVTKVDPALVELVRNELGQPVAARREKLRDVHVYWTPQRLRSLRRTALSGFFVLVVLPLALLVGNEALIRLEAARAEARRPKPAAFKSLLGTPLTWAPGNEPPARPAIWQASQNLETMFASISREYALELQAAGESTGLEGIGVWSLLSLPEDPGPGASGAAKEEYAAASRRYKWAKEVFERGRARGWSDQLDVLASAEAVAPPATPDLIYGFSGTMMAARTLALHDMREAASSDDAARFERSLRAVLNSLRCDYLMTMFSSYWRANEGELLLWSTLREAVHAHPALLEPAIAAVSQIPLEPNWANVYEFERLRALDNALSILADPSLVRFNRYTPGLREHLGGPWGRPTLPPGRIGWVSENEAFINRTYNSIIQQFKVAPKDRPPFVALSTDLLLVQTASGSLRWTLPLVDIALAQRRAAPVILAIESFRHRTSRPPDSLDDPSLGLSQRDRIDPLSGKPWGYIPHPDPRHVASLRPLGGYLLYSICPDSTDDFSRTGDPTIFIQSTAGWRTSALDGRDLLLNAQP